MSDAATGRIAIAGAGGRMGRMLIEAVQGASDLRLVAALDTPASPAVGQDAGAALGFDAGVAVTSDVDAALAGADVLIDFTRPAGTLAHLDAARRHGKRVVVGTTGFDDAQKAAIRAHAQALGIVFAPNMGVGVNVLLGLVAQAAKSLVDDFDVEVVEAHHRHKVDAPSGTALALGEAAAQAVGRRLADCAVYAREGITGERARSSIGFATVRGGDIVGEHTVLFAGSGERIELTHRATSRATFAQGALRAARFLRSRGPGLYDMQDVLGLR